MAGRKVSNAVAVALVAVLIVAAASGAAGLTVCRVDTDAMEACRSYCAMGSKEAKPTKQCCAALADADFRCLCGYKGMLRSNNLDSNRAMQIPYECTGKAVSCN